jgi:hypothetical protein
MNRDRKFRSDPASWTKGSHSLIEARATPAVSRAPRWGAAFWWIYFLCPLPGLDELLYAPGHDWIAASLARLPLLILASLVQNLTYSKITMTNLQNPVYITSYHPTLPTDPATDPALAVTATTPV